MRRKDPLVCSEPDAAIHQDVKQSGPCMGPWPEAAKQRGLRRRGPRGLRPPVTVSESVTIKLDAQNSSKAGPNPRRNRLMKSLSPLSLATQNIYE